MIKFLWEMIQDGKRKTVQVFCPETSRVVLTAAFSPVYHLLSCSEIMFYTSIYNMTEGVYCKLSVVLL